MVIINTAFITEIAEINRFKRATNMSCQMINCQVKHLSINAFPSRFSELYYHLFRIVQNGHRNFFSNVRPAGKSFHMISLKPKLGEKLNYLIFEYTGHEILRTLIIKVNDKIRQQVVKIKVT